MTPPGLIELKCWKYWMTKRGNIIHFFVKNDKLPMLSKFFELL